MNKTSELSEFGQAAVALDHDFSELQRLSGQIARLELESEADVEHARKLMGHFAQCGDRIARAVGGFAATLESARASAETAAKLVAERALLVQQRAQELDAQLEKLRVLSEKVRALTAGLAPLKKPAGTQLSDEDGATMRGKLAELDLQLAPLVDEAQALKTEARQARMKQLERDADSLGQTLAAARRRLGSLGEGVANRV